MAFTEPPSVRYEIINGKKVPVVECETEVVLRNKKTGHEYNSDKEAEGRYCRPKYRYCVRRRNKICKN